MDTIRLEGHWDHLLPVVSTGMCSCTRGGVEVLSLDNKRSAIDANSLLLRHAPDGLEPWWFDACGW